MAATSDLIFSKLAARYPTEEKTLGGLLRRYRTDQGLATYEQYRDHVTPSCLYVDGSSGASNRITTPDHASFALTDLDVRLLVQMDYWGPLFLTAHLMDQGEGSPQNSWTYSIHPSSRPRTALYDGTNIVMGVECTADFPWHPGGSNLKQGDQTLHWVRSVSDVNVGGTQKTTTYYTADYDGTTTVSSWTPQGSVTSESGVITFFDSTSPLSIPGALAITWVGRMYYAEVRGSDGGAIVANPDFRGQTPGATNFNDSTGKTWTLSGTSKIVKGSLPIADAEQWFWNAFVP